MKKPSFISPMTKRVLLFNMIPFVLVLAGLFYVDESDLFRRLFLDGQWRYIFTSAQPRQMFEFSLSVRDVAVVFGGGLIFIVLLSLYLSRALSAPIRRLARAADRIRTTREERVGLPTFRGRQDEIGDLSRSIHAMTRALQERLTAIETFAADVAHELKNPLNSMRSAVETAVRINDESKKQQLLEIILEDVQRLDRLISDISNASKLDSEMSREDFKAVDLAGLLRSLQRSYKAMKSDKKIIVVLPEKESMVVLGIEGRLLQVFHNLVDNAMSFSPPKGEIKLHFFMLDNTVEMMVDDQGPGIPDNKLEAIFDRFYTQRPQSEKFGKHSGLGLSISRLIIDAHGGWLEACNRRDEEGRVIGARFIVRLPLKV